MTIFDDLLAEEERKRKAQEVNQSVAPPPTNSMQDVLGRLTDRVMNDKKTPEQQALEAQWGQAERQSLDTATGKGGNDWASALAVALPMVLGGVADVATNRGRGLGRLAEAGAANAANLYKQNQDRQNAAQELAQKAALIRKGNGDQGFDRLAKLGTMLQENARIQAQRDALGLRGTDTQLKVEAENFRKNPNHPQALAAKAYLAARGVPPDAIDGMGFEALSHVADAYRIDLKDAHFGTELGQETTKAASTAGAGAQARLNVETNPANVEKEGGAKARVNEVVTRSGEAVKGDLAEENNSMPFGRDFADPSRGIRTIRSGNYEKAVKEMELGSNALQALDRMNAIRRKVGAGIAVSPSELTAFRTDANNVMGAMSTLGGTGTVQEGDAKRLGALLGDPTLSTEDFFAAFGRDIKAENLEGLTRTMRSIDSTIAHNYGFTGYTPSQAKQQTKTGSQVKRQPTAQPRMEDMPFYRPSGGQPAKKKITLDDL